MRIPRTITVVGVALLLAAASYGQDRSRKRRDEPVGSRRGPEHVAQTTVPDHPIDAILSRPTDTAVTVSMLAYSDMRGQVRYGTAADALTAQSPMTPLPKGQPVEVVLKSLQPDTQYWYELHYGPNGEGAKVAGTFHTQRPPGKAFVFTVQADSHLDQNTVPELYQRTLRNALADQPDFHIDLGDTFMTGKYRGRTPADLYLAQRYYFGLLCHSAPLMLVLGNHDGEPGGRGRPRSQAITLRKTYFPNPRPDGFYTGESRGEKGIGQLENYYAWEWGDALLVVLDPFWYSGKPGRGGDNWYVTLGAEQYEWLTKTLEASRAKFKMVFVHHLVGGQDKDGRCRGGAEAATFFEWGGRNPDGQNVFAQKRPGWAQPIHDLLVRHKVAAVFHGHDHFYAKQELGGVVYQLVPQPGAREHRRFRAAGDYGYVQGKILDSPGHLRVHVSPQSVRVDYVRSRRPADEKGSRTNGEIGHSYVIPARP